MLKKICFYDKLKNTDYFNKKKILIKYKKILKLHYY